jgi:hypothetical protein
MSDHGGLAFTLDGKGRTLSVTISGAVLKLVKRLVGAVPKGHKAPQLTFAVIVRDVRGDSAVLKLSVSLR